MDQVELTPREREVLRLMTQPAKVIAARLCVSISTVKSLQARIYRKLGIDGSRTGKRHKAVVKALELGIVGLEELK